MKKAYEAVSETPMQGMRFDLSGLQPELSYDTQELHLQVPTFYFSGPIFAPEALEEMKRAGLTEYDIDSAIEQVLTELQVVALARMLGKRRK
jgi:hypothetical protein